MSNVSFSVSLPKWPALIVTGMSVTEEQAAEILVRTGRWPLMTNDRDWVDITCRLGCPKPSHLAVDYRAGDEERKEQYARWTKEYADFVSTYGVLDLNYLSNDRVASCWVGGPHGWVDWKGRVYSNNYNIGKWPSVAEVLEDWQAIAAAFPYLDLTCQLMNCETGGFADDEHQVVTPLVEYRVKDGNVTVSAPMEQLPDTSFNETWVRDERGCTATQLEWALAVTRKNVSCGSVRSV